MKRRHRPFSPPARPLAAALLVLHALTAAATDPLELIGYTDIPNQPQLAESLPAAPIPVAQVEVPPAGTTDYAPDFHVPALFDKTFLHRSGPTGTSGHATLVALNFYGGGTSPAPGVADVALFSASSFLDDLLRTGRPARAPGRAGAMVVNNSWVAGYASDASNVDAVRRLDDLIVRDDVLVVNAVANDNAAPFPRLLATSYNGVSVGTLRGSFGPVAFDAAAPRSKPDLVVDTDTTSVAAALTSGAGTLLRGVARQRDLRAGELAVKAILMAGADRDGDWRRGRATGRDNVTAPLDFQQGAGQLRVDQSYAILTAGQQPADAPVAPDAGWDYARTPRRRQTVRYSLHVDQPIADWNAVLTWNRVIAGIQPDGTYSTDATLADLDLALYLCKRGGKRLVAYSDSPADNVETLQLADLPAGDYQLVLTTDARSYYALAWYADLNGAPATPTRQLAFADTPAAAAAFPAGDFTAVAVPEPSTLLWLAPTLLLTRRRGHKTWSPS